VHCLACAAQVADRRSGIHPAADERERVGGEVLHLDDGGYENVSGFIMRKLNLFEFVCGF
jgi:hypothetical protein